MAEKGGLRENLGFEKRRCRLKWNRREFLEPMKPAGGMDVTQGHRENQTSRQHAEPARPVSSAFLGPAPNHVVALVDRFQEWLEMSLLPGFFRRRHEHKR